MLIVPIVMQSLLVYVFVFHLVAALIVLVLFLLGGSRS